MSTPIEYTVQQGDCIDTIAAKHRVTPELIWEDSANAELKRLRKDPNVLLKGDVVHIPAVEANVFTVAANQRHVFVAKRPKAFVRLKLTRDPAPEKTPPHTASGPGLYVEPVDYHEGAPVVEPWANVNACLVAGEQRIESESDGEGFVEFWVPISWRAVTLIVAAGTKEERSFELSLGGLDPASEPSGAFRRLVNLGYSGSEKELSGMLSAFQHDHGLTPSGALDETTQSKLRALHGS